MDKSHTAATAELAPPGAACLDSSGTSLDLSLSPAEALIPSTHRKPLSAKQTAHHRNLALAIKCDEAGLETYAEPLRMCTVTSGLFICSGCGNYSYHPNHCKSRLCAYCAPAKAKKRAKLVRYMLSHMVHPKFLTLTMARCDALKDGLSRIRKAFTRWRNWKQIKPMITGGYYQLEVVAKDDGWHVHLHALIDGQFLPKNIIWTTWAKALGVKQVNVDISAASRGEVAHEVAKYAAKAVQVKDWTPDQLAEFVAAMKNCRLSGTFGEWFNAKVDELLHEDPPDPLKCPHCGKEKTLMPIRAGPYHYGKDWDYLFNQLYSHLPDSIPNPAIDFVGGSLPIGTGVQLALPTHQD